MRKLQLHVSVCSHSVCGNKDKWALSVFWPHPLAERGRYETDMRVVYFRSLVDKRPQIKTWSLWMVISFDLVLIRRPTFTVQLGSVGLMSSITRRIQKYDSVLKKRLKEEESVSTCWFHFMPRGRWEDSAAERLTWASALKRALVHTWKQQQNTWLWLLIWCLAAMFHRQSLSRRSEQTEKTRTWNRSSMLHLETQVVIVTRAVADCDCVCLRFLVYSVLSLYNPLQCHVKLDCRCY